MYEPKRPTLAALGLMNVWLALLALPMFSGQWLGAPGGDFNPAGFASRTWGAEWWHRLGHVPLWEPALFGGMPYIGAGHGDIFYPTSFLRLVWPIAAVVNLGFVLHYVLAGLFTYLLLRRLGASWSGSVVGGLAYELTGLLASYPSPGHDGKLFASAALPLACLALVLALREKRPWGYALLAAAIAMSLLGHFQLAYYNLVAAGLFALYLSFGEPTAEPVGVRVTRLGIALAAVLLAFGLAAIQVLPFMQYIPFSPRATGYHGYEGSTSFAIPWSHVPEFFLKGFTGARETYWGPNPLKLHSEYLGLPVAALAVLGAWAKARRRLIYWLGGIGALFLLISLGAGTPFYRLFWAIMPLIKKTRAPGMAFYVVAFVLAAFAALGVERLEKKEGRAFITPWLIVGGIVALLAVSGAFGTLAANLAGPRAPAARADAQAILFGAMGSGFALLVVALCALALVRDRLTPRLFSLILALVVGCDLWLNARGFWIYMPDPRQDWLRPDSVTRVITQTPLPYRVLDTGVYGADALMAFDVPQVLGYHGNELRYYDDLLGGKNVWSNLRFSHLWDLLAVRYVLLPVGGSKVDSIPGYQRIMDSAVTNGEAPARVFLRTDPQPYARVVPAAVKGDTDEVIGTLIDPRFDYNRIVLFDRTEAINPLPVTEMPPPSPSHASFTRWVPGEMSLTLHPPPPQDSYLLVAENWFPDWQATVDGRPATVLRGDASFITVLVSAGARSVELRFTSPIYERGRLLSCISLLVLGAWVGGALVWQRRRSRPARA